MRKASSTFPVFVWLAIGASLTLVLVFYWYPKSVLLDDGGRLFFHGFGVEDTRDTVLGRYYTRASFSITSPEDGVCEADLTRVVEKDGREFYGFVAHYPNGRIRARGLGEVIISTGQVDGQGIVMRPSVSLLDVAEGTFYHPQDNGQSIVRDGTGVETFWTHDGTKVWELELEGFQRRKLRVWHRNGQLRAEYAFKDGKKHGTVEFFDAGGNTAGTITYQDGLLVSGNRSPDRPTGPDLE